MLDLAGQTKAATTAGPLAAFFAYGAMAGSYGNGRKSAYGRRATVRTGRSSAYELSTGGLVTHTNEALLKTRPLYNPDKDLEANLITRAFIAQDRRRSLQSGTRCRLCGCRQSQVWALNRFRGPTWCNPKLRNISATG